MNTVTFIGNLGNSPRVRTLPNGTPVADFDLAINRRYTNNGQVIEQTTWVNVTCWRGLAQTVGAYLTKGRQVAVTGRLEAPDAYTGRDGKPYARNRVTAMSVEFLGAAPASINQDMEEALEAGAASVPATEESLMAAAIDAF